MAPSYRGLTATTSLYLLFFFFSSRRRHTRLQGDWSSDVCSSDLQQATASQESVETEGERPARSDTSLERIAELPAAAQLPDGKWQPGVNYQPLVQIGRASCRERV